MGNNFVIDRDKKGNFIYRMRPELFRILKQSHHAAAQRIDTAPKGGG